FPYQGRIVNLLDTPGHEDFAADTYRTLTAVDSALMAIDAARGLEPRTIKLKEACRMTATPIITSVTKLDRSGRTPREPMDEIERVLEIRCAPVTWPIGMGHEFRGVYHLLEDRIYLYRGDAHQAGEHETIDGLDDPRLPELLGQELDTLLEDIELVREAGHPF